MRQSASTAPITTEGAMVETALPYMILPLYTLHFPEEGKVVDQYGNPFDVKRYSRFKHGCNEPAMEYGYALGQLLLQQRPELMHADAKVFVMSSAYKYVPVAASAIAHYVQHWVTFRRYNVGLRSADAWKIHRRTIFEGDFSRLPAAEREVLMGKNKLYVDKRLLSGRDVVIVDDVRITGSHERKIWDEISSIQMRSCTFLYLATVNPEIGDTNSVIESVLNQAFVKTLDDLSTVIHTSNNHIINGRVVKFILKEENLVALKRFLKQQSPYFLYELMMAIVSDEYHRMEKYMRNAHFIIQHCWDQGLLDDTYGLLPFAYNERMGNASRS